MSEASDISMQETSNNCLIVLLPRYLSDSKELQKINLAASENPDRDIILDFSMVEVVLSVSISNLLSLRDLLEKADRRLILCSVSFLNRCVFTTCGLGDVFTFADDKAAALAELHSTHS